MAAEAVPDSMSREALLVEQVVNGMLRMVQVVVAEVRAMGTLGTIS